MSKDDLKTALERLDQLLAADSKSDCEIEEQIDLIEKLESFLEDP